MNYIYYSAGSLVVVFSLEGGSNLSKSGDLLLHVVSLFLNYLVLEQ